MNFQRIISSIAISALILGGSGCSSLGFGGKDKNGGLSEADLNAQREARFGEGGIPTAEGEGMFRDIHFDYDSAAISESARMDADFNAQVLKDHSDLKVQIEGHCDERGTNDYNLALGLERAKAVQSLLVSFGIPRSRLDTISYGEEVPLDPSHSEAAWAKNRRAHLSAFGDKK